MNILAILLVLIVVGFVLWLVENFIPMDDKIKMLVRIVAIIVVIIWLLQAFGVWGYLSKVRI